MSVSVSSELSVLKRWTLACLLTGVTIVGAKFALPLPMTPVPLTFQVFAVLLSGLLLGSRWGALAQIQYLILGALHVPVFASANSGSGVLFGITGGYLLSYPVAAFAVGWILERHSEKGDHKTLVETSNPIDHRGNLLTKRVCASLAGIGVIYCMGCSWMSLVTHAPLFPTVFQGALVFVCWDLFKAALSIGTVEMLTFSKRKFNR